MNEHGTRGTGEGTAAGGGPSESSVAGSIGARDVLTDLLRKGAVDLIAAAVEAEVAGWINDHVTDPDDRRQVVRNGSMPQREIVTGIGPVKQPRVHDRRAPEEGREAFTSQVLPPYLRKTRSVEELIPWLYPKGVSTGDFSEALAALIGADVPGFPASTVTRLKESWESGYKAWNSRDLTGREYVRADGVYSGPGRNASASWC